MAEQSTRHAFTSLQARPTLLLKGAAVCRKVGTAKEELQMLALGS